MIRTAVVTGGACTRSALARIDRLRFCWSCDPPDVLYVLTLDDAHTWSREWGMTTHHPRVEFLSTKTP